MPVIPVVDSDDLSPLDLHIETIDIVNDDLVAYRPLNNNRCFMMDITLTDGRRILYASKYIGAVQYWHDYFAGAFVTKQSPIGIVKIHWHTANYSAAVDMHFAKLQPVASARSA